MKSWIASALAFTVFGCGAVFPEVAPPLRSPPAGRELSPPPPDDLLFVTFAEAEIPARTRDGRKWDSMGGEAPDVFAKLFVDDKEIIRTPIHSDSLKPTWPDQKKANYRVPERAKVRVELWDSNPINNQPICIKRLFDLPGQAGPVPVDVECDSGAQIRLRVEPAHARWGLGFSYELRTTGAAVTRVVGQSPAARGGIKAGDEIIEAQGGRVAKMEEGELQSKINANAQVGVELVVRGANGEEKRVTLKDGPVYPSVEEDIPLD